MQPNTGKILGVRGVSWREKETRDLLEIWGERKMQEALRATHRNIGNFEKIAAEMVARGHNRTAEECRTKTKALRMEYRKVLAHNSQTGNHPVTCAFFKELSNIMTVGAMMPQRIVKSIHYQTTPAPVPSFQQQPGSEELFTHSLTMINPDHIHESPSEAESSVQQAAEEDSDAMFMENFPDQGKVEVPIEGSLGGGTDCPTPVGNAGDGGSPVGEGWPTPNTKLARSRTKRRRVPGLASISERMMEHSSRLFERDLEERRRENEAATRARAEDIEDRRLAREQERLAREQEMLAREQEHQDRMLVHEALRRNIEVLNSAVEAFKDLVATCQFSSGFGLQREGGTDTGQS